MADAIPTRHAGKQIKMQPHEVTANASLVNVASGGAAAATMTPATGYRGGVEYIAFGYRVATASGSITISDGTLTIGPISVILGGLQQLTPPRGLLFGKNAQITVTMADGSQAKDMYVMFFQEAGDGGV